MNQMMRGGPEVVSQAELPAPDDVSIVVGNMSDALAFFRRRDPVTAWRVREAWSPAGQPKLISIADPRATWDQQNECWWTKEVCHGQTYDVRNDKTYGLMVRVMTSKMYPRLKKEQEEQGVGFDDPERVLGLGVVII